MKYRRLGKTNLCVSVIGVGTWQLGGEWGKNFEQAEVDAMLASAFDLGINLIDTAACYGDHLSETLIGEAVKERRDKWIIATKFGHKFHRPFERDQIYDPDFIRNQLEGSLRALQTDYIDLYQFHGGGDEMFDTPGLWDMLQEQVGAGKVRHLGISISQTYEGTHQVEAASDIGAQAIQVVYNRLERRPEDYTFDACVKQDLGVLARVPLASGFLTGKYSKDSQFDKSDVRGRWFDQQQREEIIEQAEKARKEVPEGIPMAQWALAWPLQHPAVTCVIPGCKNVEQVQNNAKAADLAMVKPDHPGAVS